MTACLSTIESCNADLTPVIFKSRGRSLCKRKHREMEMEGSLTKWRGVFKTIACDFVTIARTCESKRPKHCSWLVHEVWNNTFSFSWSLVIPYCPVGHTHFRYHIRPFPFHAGRCKLQQMHRPCGKFRHWEMFIKAWLVPNIPILNWIEGMNYNMCAQWAQRRGTWLKLMEKQQIRDIYEG